MEKTKNKNKSTTLPFIKTSDKDTSDLLMKDGFQLVDYDGKFWTFLNDTSKNTKANFADKKITFSNKLCI